MRAASIERILLIQLYGLGDIILLTPAIREVRRHFPDARIDFLTWPMGADAVAGNPNLDGVLIYPRDVDVPWRLIREIRRRRYDAIVDFRSIPRTALLVGLSGARLRSGVRGRGPRNLFYQHLVPKYLSPDEYSAKRNFDLLAPLGIAYGPDTDLSLDLVVSDAERAWADDFWQRCGLDAERPVVALSAVYALWYKNWGAERWAAVGDALMDAGLQVVLTQGPNERAQVEAVVEKMRHQPVWGQEFTSIRQMAAFYQRCTLWVGHDGGPKHMAAAVGTPTISVFRWKHGLNWTDTSPGSPHFFLEKAPPQGCDLHCESCEHRGCLAAISAEEVTAAVMESLRSLGSSAARKLVLPVLRASSGAQDSGIVHGVP